MNFPGTIWKPLVNHSAPGKLLQRDRIVCHITEGPSAQSAWNTFAASKAPHRVSAHFIVDRNGEIWQCVSMLETAWHASAMNERSIGIEHAAISGGKLPITDAQYAASSKLIAGVAKMLGIPCDRKHVLSHYEASPQDGHVLCCQPTLDLDKLVALATVAG